jgi:3-oxoadipate enol-lactonase
VFADIDGNTLHYVSYGEGPPVVFVHGLGGSSERLARRHAGHAAAPPRGRHGPARPRPQPGPRQVLDRGLGQGRPEADPAPRAARRSPSSATRLGTLVAQHLAQTSPDCATSSCSSAASPTSSRRPRRLPRARRPRRGRGGMDVLVDAWLEGAVSPRPTPPRPATVGLLRELFLRNEPPTTPSPAGRSRRPPHPPRRDRPADADRHRRARPVDAAGDGRGAALVDPGQPRQGAARRRPLGPVEAPGALAATILEFLT